MVPAFYVPQRSECLSPSLCSALGDCAFHQRLGFILEASSQLSGSLISRKTPGETPKEALKAATPGNHQWWAFIARCQGELQWCRSLSSDGKVGERNSAPDLLLLTLGACDSSLWPQWWSASTAELLCVRSDHGTQDNDVSTSPTKAFLYSLFPQSKLSLQILRVSLRFCLWLIASNSNVKKIDVENLN